VSGRERALFELVALWRAAALTYDRGSVGLGMDAVKRAREAQSAYDAAYGERGQL
jgi:hypothetical protein